jgi:Glycosyl transferases group 1
VRRGRDRVLLVTKEFSTTPTSGGMLRTLALFEQLAAQYETTVISPDGIVIARTDGTRRSQPPSALSPGLRGRAEQAATFERYRSISGVRIGGSALLANLRRGASGRYSVGIVDHTCLAGLADGLATGCDRVLVSMHNIESDLMDQRAKAAPSPATGLPMAMETRLLRRLEAEVAAKYPLILTTQADADALPGVKEAIVCRNGIFSAEGQRGAYQPLSMVFTGALDWEPNVAGLVWFAREVWPIVRGAEPGATVTVAGRNPGPAVVQACDRTGITLLPNPPEMAPVLDASQLGIVPLLSGGGSRIKILEYLAAGIDVVSTEVGASGLEDIPADLVDRLPADPRIFAEALVTRLRAPGGNGAQAKDWVRKNYAWDVTLQPMMDYLAR